MIRVRTESSDNGPAPIARATRELSLPTPIRPRRFRGLYKKEHSPAIAPSSVAGAEHRDVLGLPPWGRSSPRCVRLWYRQRPAWPWDQAGLPVGIAGTALRDDTRPRAKSHDPPLQSLEPLLEAPLLGPSRAWPPHRIRRASSLATAARMCSVS